MQPYWSALQFAPAGLPIFLLWYATDISRNDTTKVLKRIVTQ